MFLGRASYVRNYRRFFRGCFVCKNDGPVSLTVSERVIAAATKVAITIASPVLRKNTMSDGEIGWGDKAINEIPFFRIFTLD